MRVLEDLAGFKAALAKAEEQNSGLHKQVQNLSESLEKEVEARKDLEDLHRKSANKLRRVGSSGKDRDFEVILCRLQICN